MQVILIIISFILSILIVNGAYKFFMTIIGANVMFFNAKTKLVAMFLVTVLIFGIFSNLFGLSSNTDNEEAVKNQAEKAFDWLKGDNINNSKENTKQENINTIDSNSSEYNEGNKIDDSNVDAKIQESLDEENHYSNNDQISSSTNSDINSTNVDDSLFSNKNYHYGKIITNGANIVGFSTSYVCNDGAPEIVKDNLGDGWRIKSSEHHYSYGINWYELYDADDGDYYGWVDGNYIYWE